VTTVSERLAALPTIDRRTALAIAAGFASALLVLALTAPPSLTAVLVADGPLPAGTALGDLPVTYRNVDNTDGLIVGSDIGELADWTLVTPLAEGEPLLVSLIQPPQQVTAPQQMALAIPATQAVLGEIQAGDTVDILVTRSAGVGSEATTEVLARDVYVISAVLAESTAFGDELRLLLAVTDQLAVDLANASYAGNLDLIKVNP
jgi:Flp pilus assembly protein CpaB